MCNIGPFQNCKYCFKKVQYYAAHLGGQEFVTFYIFMEIYKEDGDIGLFITSVPKVLE